MDYCSQCRGSLISDVDLPTGEGAYICSRCGSVFLVDGLQILKSISVPKRWPFPLEEIQLQPGETLPDEEYLQSLHIHPVNKEILRRMAILIVLCKRFKYKYYPREGIVGIYSLGDRWSVDITSPKMKLMHANTRHTLNNSHVQRCFTKIEELVLYLRHHGRYLYGPRSKEMRVLKALS